MYVLVFYSYPIIQSISSEPFAPSIVAGGNADLRTIRISETTQALSTWKGRASRMAEGRTFHKLDKLINQTLRAQYGSKTKNHEGSRRYTSTIEYARTVTSPSHILPETSHTRPLKNGKRLLTMTPSMTQDLLDEHSSSHRILAPSWAGAQKRSQRNDSRYDSLVLLAGYTGHCDITAEEEKTLCRYFTDCYLVGDLLPSHALTSDICPASRVLMPSRTAASSLCPAGSFEKLH
jgi:hypothetical protein